MGGKHEVELAIALPEILHQQGFRLILIVFSPVILWNLTNDYASLGFNLNKRLSFDFNLVEIFRNLVVFLLSLLCHVDLCQVSSTLSPFASNINRIEKNTQQNKYARISFTDNPIHELVIKE